MKRKALLIGCPGERKKGSIYNAVMHDLDYFKTYLMSSAGGEWTEDEILPFSINQGSLSISAKIAFLNATKPDYSIVYYSGHGGEYRSRKQVIEINDGEFSVVNLKTSSPKQLIIIDSCRVILDSESEGFLKEAILEDYTYVSNSRQIFNSYLEKCENGIILLNAASFEEEAGCNQTESYFTSSLIEAGKEWNNSIGGEEDDQILDIWAATNSAQEIMEINFVTKQHADCNIGRRRRSFPFAVKNCIL